MIQIPKSKAEWAYESMACFAKDAYRMPVWRMPLRKGPTVLPATMR